MAVMIRRSAGSRRGDWWDEDSEPIIRHEPLLAKLDSEPTFEVYLVGPSQFWRDEIRVERLQARIAASLPSSLRRRVDFQEDDGPYAAVHYVEYIEPDDDTAW